MVWQFGSEVLQLCMYYDQFNGSMLACGYELTNYQLLVNWVKL